MFRRQISYDLIDIKFQDLNRVFYDVIALTWDINGQDTINISIFIKFLQTSAVVRSAVLLY